MFQNVVVVSVIDHKNSPGFEQTVKVGNSSSLILLISTKRAKSPAFLFGIPVTFSFKNSLDKVGKILKGSIITFTFKENPNYGRESLLEV